MKKTKVIYIYGAPATGKLTTAKALSLATGFKLAHNHLTTDLVRSIFERGNPKGDMYIVKLRFEILEMALQENVSGIIMTGAHAHNYLYPNGESDEWYATRLEEITQKNGGEFYGVNLTTSNETLLQRVTESNRKEWGKISTIEILKDSLAKYDYFKTAPLQNNLIIDNTDVSPEEVAKKIIDFAEIH
ncbi:AAA family ATPase [Candidatus Parcubacteria bacterium]|uniref:Shikimate kinase n=1 Tax=Candidatus Kaiserbacteria bacterium CG10_big_fil_rev_8_21_14_0_10_47_16 TaxID=1974608 RepID=A0A2H0UEM9_9BACT|nr:AAA family ATPase [Candidatus Parcubacteria bacterium]PIR84810.1 MAG: hypothetical protein COU16_01330 [Candidatus Kaiserbacteria bacterium CG10_big_fil_rev_8_21_14_0_10_47_16]